MRRSIIAAIGLALSSCAQVRYDPPSQEVRDDLGSIAVVAIPAYKTTQVDRPASGGDAALYGAGQGALGSLKLGLGLCRASVGMRGYNAALVCAFGLAVAIATAPVTALAGAGIGAVSAHSEDEIERASTGIENVLRDARPSEALRDAVVRSARARVGFEIESRPTGAPGKTFGAWSEEGLDTILEVQITRMQLPTRGEIHPDVTMLLEAKADFIRTRDTQLLYSRSWIYRSEEREFFDLAIDDGRRLRREILDGIETIAHKIVYDLFISTKPESPPAAGYPVGLPVTVFTWTPKGS